MLPNVFPPTCANSSAWSGRQAEKLRRVQWLLSDWPDFLKRFRKSPLVSISVSQCVSLSVLVRLRGLDGKLRSFAVCNRCRLGGVTF